MRRRLVFTSVTTLALCGLLVLPSLAGGAKATKAEVGKPAPGFELPDYYGKKFKLSDFKGRVVVLEWLNQDCPVSLGKHNDKTMQKTFAKYAADGVVWLGIDSTHYMDAERNRVYAAQKGLVFPILHDPSGKVGKMYGARTTPHMYVIDKHGKLVYDGAIDDKGSRNYVAEAIEATVKGSTVVKGKTRPYGCSIKYKS